MQSIWHPCSQMKDYEKLKPLKIKRTEGCYIELVDGRKVIDAISSWWCKLLGHQHPLLKKALLEQVESFEHVILANTTNEVIQTLSEQLTQLMPHLEKVFYAGDGSSAVEIALKMSLHSRQITGESKRKNFIALANGYHGETVGAMSVSDIGLYRKPYESMLFNTHFINQPPYVTSMQDSIWFDCSENWLAIEKQLTIYAETTTAIILEPIVQGAGGMRIYSQDFLKRLANWAKKNHIHLIADEIMTGMARTGRMLACEYADIKPDFICLGKGLTAGWLPFSAVLTTDIIYQLFYADYKENKSFLHSHTFSGNVLGARIALQVLHLIKQLKLCETANCLGINMLEKMQQIANETNKLKNVRQIGAIVAADLSCASKDRRLGFEVYQKAIEFGALLRPLGDTIYWLPPLITSFETIAELKVITQKALSAVAF